MKLRLARLPSPIGTLLLVSDDEAVYALEFHDDEARLQRLLERHHGGRIEFRAGPALGGTAARIAAYFAGDLAAIDAIPVRTGGSTFQRRVWTALRQIPLGTTTSYGRLAAAIGAPAASRAVGLANGANPVAIIVPCHRVVGADGSLTGYGGGLSRKAWLLRHENRGHPHPAP
jgi:methylated-DNA-[protein]-cysteine S-methyltransferase